MNNNGFNMRSYDPFYDDKAPDNVSSHFDLVTCFEVLEHVPCPQSSMRDMLGYLKSDGIIIFSTLVSDGHIQENGRLNWWYASPRNGHISIYTRKSLQILAAKYSLNLYSFSEGTHMFYNSLPYWAQKAFSVKS